MKLIDLLETVNDNTNVNVWYCGEMVTRYDGRDNIDPIYNDYKVAEISIVNKQGAFNGFKDCLAVEIVDC